MENKIFAVGNIRPPFHAHSLLLQVTENCTWNRCNFCTLYKNGSFKMKSFEEMKRDIDNAAYYRDLILERLENYDLSTVKRMGEMSSGLSYKEKLCYSIVLNWITFDGMKTVFLQDANTMAIKKNDLCKILAYLRKTFPSLETVSCYGRADTLSRLSLQDFKDLREAGLTMLHSGYESGCDEVLRLLNKGTCRQQQIDAGKRIREAGITFNMFYMPGCGGKALSERNAIETAEVANEIEPDYLHIRTFVVKSGAPMWKIAYGPDFTECSDIEKVREIRTMVDRLDSKLSTFVISDHIINLLPRLEGCISTDKTKLLEYIDNFLALPPQRQKEYQLARRMWSTLDYTEMDLVSEQDMRKIRDLADQTRDGEDFEKLLRSYLRNYI